MSKKPTPFRQACFERGYTAAYVAEQIGVAKPTVYAYFRGLRVPNIETMKRIKDLLGYESLESVTELFGL